MQLMKERLGDAVFRGLMWHWTCCSPGQEPTFREILRRIVEECAPGMALEIGTHQGVSAALVAEYVPQVITVDVLPNPARAKVWAALDVQKRIVERVYKSQADRDQAIRYGAMEADFAFIDGSHLRRDIEYDFSLVSPYCKRIILHDYWQSGEDWPDVKEFVDGLDLEMYHVEIHKPFVYVEVK